MLSLQTSQTGATQGFQPHLSFLLKGATPEAGMLHDNLPLQADVNCDIP